MSLLHDARKKLSGGHDSRDDDNGDEDVTVRASKLSPNDFREVLRLGMKHHKGAKGVAPGEEGPAEGTDECPHCGRSGASEDIMDRGHRESLNDDNKFFGD